MDIYGMEKHIALLNVSAGYREFAEQYLEEDNYDFVDWYLLPEWDSDPEQYSEWSLDMYIDSYAQFILE